MVRHHQLRREHFQTDHIPEEAKAILAEERTQRATVTEGEDGGIMWMKDSSDVKSLEN